MGDAVVVQSRSKLNWYLRVLEPREDGFHDIETIFQELQLSDELSFELIDAEACEITGFPDDVPTETNLIRQAWELLRRPYAAQVGGVRVSAVKTIPRGGGLGGGSSNAAATLLALNKIFNLQLSRAELETLAATLGSDVPFFVRGGIAVGRGRGELLESLPVPPQYHVVLVQPGHGISTREAYSRLDALPLHAKALHSLEGVRRAVLTGNPHRLAAAIHNDFEQAVERENWYKRTVSALDQAGCLRAFLCGSGSTVAGLCENQSHCSEVNTRLNNILPYTRFVTCTLAGSGAEVR